MMSKGGFPLPCGRIIRIKRSRYTSEQIQQRQMAIAAALKEQGLTGSIAYDYRTDKIEVGVGAEEPSDQLMQKIPVELGPDVTVHREFPSTFQTGTMSGDAIYGGWTMNKSEQNPSMHVGLPYKGHRGQ